MPLLKGKRRWAKVTVFRSLLLVEREEQVGTMMLSPMFLVRAQFQGLKGLVSGAMKPF